MSERVLKRNGEKRYLISVIDGPNMSNLGRRNKKVYGAINSLEDLQNFMKEAGNSLGVDVETFASNYEGAILEYIHESAERVDGYIINPAGLTEVGEATRHALDETGKPVIEVHFANIAATGLYPRGVPHGPLRSRFSPTVTGVAMGLRQYSYLAALVGLVWALDDKEFLGAGNS
ncbi:MAG: dehydroquinase [Bacillus thermozeamaize]|uniref:3-dehydroquinate dehydratase n=1 Tax=Bacillus thermozeamaize TaxID=230954 RepID=A0A1Y3PL91_9BACI|nr:MAG: dehydroquinase [Bacillus thermozeamaize]